MKVTTRPLTFHAVDDIGFAALLGGLEPAGLRETYVPDGLGPLMELLNLAAGGLLPDLSKGSWLDLDSVRPMIDALRKRLEFWVSPASRAMGFIRALRKGPDSDNRFTCFLMDAQRAARDLALLPGTTPGQLAAAMEELESNIHEHSNLPESGLIAYRAVRGVFEFVVADRGIGILSSLKTSPFYAGLLDHGRALELALTDGTSRFGSEGGRGHGFRPIFVGLANLYGCLRFRSGDHALTIDGTSPSLTTAQLSQKPSIEGFFASVRVTHNSV